tara:strand:+ start:1162 stop:1290 length:129 start_codon:yes stop_codon:yes gene_type:complete
MEKYKFYENRIISNKDRFKLSYNDENELRNNQKIEIQSRKKN